MSPLRRTALAAGLLYLITFVTSIPAALLKTPLVQSPHLLAPADEPLILWAAVLEVVLALSCIGTAVVLFPLIRRHGEIGAIGFVAARTLEAAIIMAGLFALLAAMSVQQEIAGLGATSAEQLSPVLAALVAVHDWAFLLGPGLIPAVNAVFLASVLYRARLVPRFIPLLGLIGAPLLVLSAGASLFGLTEQVSALAALAALPIALWELLLGLWLTFRGFRAADNTPAESAAVTA